ncbi:MAG: hypothetical protein AMXMBFR64_49510 [Myxococcales bacterium]
MRVRRGLLRVGVVALCAVAGGVLLAQQPPIVLPPVIGEPVRFADPVVADPQEPVEPAVPEEPQAGTEVPEVPVVPVAGEGAVVESPVVVIPPEAPTPDAGEPNAPSAPASVFEAAPEPVAPIEVPVPPVVPPVAPVPPLVESALRSQTIEELGTELVTLRVALTERQILLDVRERELAVLREALLAEMTTLEALQDKLDRRWTEADDAWQAAHAALLLTEAGCQCTADPEAAVAEREDGAPAGPTAPTPEDEREKRVVQVVAIIKGMQPESAARVVQSWDDGLATMALSRLPARVASKVVASLPPEHAARLTSNMIRGNVSLGGMP